MGPLLLGLGLSVVCGAIAAPPVAASVQLPQMVPATEIGGVLQAPVGWTASQSIETLPNGGQVVGYTLEEAPGSAEGAAVMVMLFPLFQGLATPELFAAAMRENLQDRVQQDVQNVQGAVTEVWSGTIGGNDAMLALRYGADPAAGQGMLVTFAAPPARYTQLGGLWMLDAIFPSSQPQGVAAQPAPAQPAAAQPAPAPTAAPASTGGLQWHKCRCYEKQFGIRAGYTVCAADPVGAAYWETIAISCLPDGCTNCVCAPSGESCSQDGQML